MHSSWRIGVLIILFVSGSTALETALADRNSGAGSVQGQSQPRRHEVHQELAPATFAGQVQKWLGKFHQPAANFPIALLIAAAVAEGCYLRGRWDFFDHAVRFCLWFGAVMAVVTGLTGWFNGGWEVVDTSWVKTTHRWVGTSTDLLTLVTLALCEASHRPGRQWLRRPFRLLLFLSAFLVLAAGFFGGALVYGIDHYAWPKPH